GPNMTMGWKLAGLASLLLACGAEEVGSTADDLRSGPRPHGRIVFTSEASGNFEIYVARPGGGVEQITDDPRADFQPAWSPDGRRIVFSRVEDDGSQHLWVMDADGGRARQLGSASAGDPRWSPDGRRIAFTAFPPDVSRFDVGVMDADGGD